MLTVTPTAVAASFSASIQSNHFVNRQSAYAVHFAALRRALTVILAVAVCSIALLPRTSSAQTNIYWDTSTNSGIGGSGTFSSSGVNWATNPLGAAVSSGGPTGNALFAVTNTNNGVNAWASGNYAMNFGGTAGTVTIGGAYQMWGINILTNGYVFTVNNTASRTWTLTNSLALASNSVTFSNGASGLNSLTLAGPANGWTGGITASNGSAGITIVNNNATNFGFYVGNGGSVSSNAPINIVTAAGSRVMLGSQSSGGASFNSAITNNSAGGSPLELTNSSSGTVAFNGRISGSNGLVLNQSGSGAIALNAANTYTGGTTVNATAGDIKFSNNSAFGTNTITIAGAGTNYLRGSNNASVSNAVVINAGSVLRLGASASGDANTWSGAISGAGSLLYNLSGSLYLTSSNSSFGGGVVNGSSGTLYITKLGNAGANSSLGTNGTVTFGIQPATSGAAALRWIGTADDTSDKNFVMGATNAIAGMQILNNGSGTNLSLTLNGNISANNNSNKVVTLGSYSNNNLILNGQIVENGGSLFSLVVGTSSSGTVTLNNTNNNISGGVTITNATASTTTTLSAAKIGNAGETGSLGTNGTINVGISSSSGTASLSYSGSGETNNRSFNLTASSGTLQFDQSGTGNVKFTGNIASSLSGTRTIKLQGSTAGTGELGSALTNIGGGVTSLNKSGTGTWTLSGQNTYTGTTTLAGGGLILSGTNTGNGDITLAAGTTLDVSGQLAGANLVSVNTAGSVLKIGQTNGMANAVLLGASSGASIGSVILTGGGNYVVGTFGNSASGGQSMNFSNSSGLATTLTFTNATNYITTSSGNSAARTLTNASADLTIVFGGSSLDIGSSSSAANSVTFAGSGSYTVNANIINTNVGVRSLTKTGTGVLTLNGSNSYNGTTTVSGGTVRISDANALGTTNNGTVVADGAALELTNGISVGNESLSLGGTGVSAGGALRSLGGDNTYGGVVTLSTNSRINANAGILRLTNGTISGAFDLTLGGAGNMAVSSIIGTSTGSLTKDGAGTLTLSGANTYSGVTTISGGTLVASNGLALGSATTASVGSGATLQVSAAITKGTITNSGTIRVNEGASLTADSLGSGSTGSLVLVGSSGNQAVFTDSAAAGTSVSSTVLDVGDLTLSGYGTLALNNAYNKILASGSVSISGTGNLFNLTGAWDAGQTYTLLEGTTGFSASGIQLTGTTLGGATLDFGQDTTVGRTTYLYDTNATSLFITVTGGAGNITWNTNNGLWDTDLGNTPWTNNADGSASAFYSGDNVTLGTAGSEIEVVAGGLLAGSVAVNNANGMVTLFGGAVTNTSFSKTEAGSVILSNNILSTGTLTVSAGGFTSEGTVGAQSLVVSGGDAALNGAVDISSGATNSGGTLTSGSAFTAGSLVVNGGTTTLNGATTLSDGVIVSSGSLVANTSLTVSAGNVSVSGGSASLNAGSVITNDVTVSGGTLTVSNANSVAGALRLSGGTVDGGGTITAAGGYALTNGSVGAILAGSAAVTKAGTGTVVLSAANTFTGTTTVSGGTLNIQNASALGATNGATLVTNNSTLALEGDITAGAGELLTIVGGSTLRNVSGSNTYAGPIFFASSGSSNAIIFASDAGTLTLASFATNTTLSSARLVEVTGSGNTLVTGRFTGTGSSTVTKNGSGTLTLANTNFDVGGGFIINNGSLVLATNNALGATRAVVVNGGTVDIGAFNNTVGAVTLTNGAIAGSTGVLSGTSYAVENGTISAILGGSGSLTKSGNGTVTLSGTNTYSGGSLVSAGVLSGETASLQGNITNNAAVIFNQSANGTYASVLSGSGTLLKTNAGTLILTGANTQNGGTTIGQGTLQIGNGGSTGSLAGDITNNGTLAYNLTGASTQLTVISGSGTVTKSGAGTVTLSGANTYSGGTLVSAGVLAGDTTSMQGNITNNATTTFSQTTNGTYAGTMSGSGALTKSGAGTVTLSASNSYDGVTTVSAGALTLSDGSALGSATGGTTVAAGGTLQLQGGITIDGEALTLNGGASTTTLRNISGNNTYNGAITFNSGTNRIDSDADTLTLSSFANTLSSVRSLLVGGAGNTTFSGRFTGSSSGTITKDGAGTLTLSATNFAINGGVIVNAGTLALGTNDALGATTGITVNNATFDLGSYSNAMGDVTVTNGGRITNGTLTGSSYASGAVGKTNTISANLTGSGGLTLIGNSNTTVLSGANSYSGDTALNNTSSTNMRLRVNSTNALSSNSSLLGSSSAARTPTLELAAAGNYTMQNFKGGNMIFLATNGAATISFTNTSITNEMTAGDKSFYATNVNVSFAGALDVSATTDDKDFRFFGDGDYTLDGSILTTNNTFTSSLVAGTTGTVTLNASNNYNGTTTVNSNATLLLGNNNALGTTNSGTTVVSGGALDLGGSAISDEALSVAGTGVSSGGAIKNSSGTAASFSGAVTFSNTTTIATTNGKITLSGAIGQTAGTTNGLTKTGSSTLTLSGADANTYTGSTTINGGVLELNKTAGVNAIAGAVTVGSGAKLLLSANNQVANTSAITLSGGTIQRGSGVSETFGDLDLTASSFLDFGTGDTGTLSFGTYTPSSLLTINSFLPGNTLTFGSDLTSSINNATYFSFSGNFTSSWSAGTSTFTITAIPEPSTYVAAIALLGLMLWPSRRRLLKDAKSILGLRAPARDRFQSR